MCNEQSTLVTIPSKMSFFLQNGFTMSLLTQEQNNAMQNTNVPENADTNSLARDK